MIDANANRAKEALRVIEDILRFSLEEKSLMSEAKRIRHRLNRTFFALPISYRKLLASRNSRGDIGKDRPMAEHRRVEIRDLFLRNTKRAGEAIRVLEECGQIFAPARSRDFERLRFAVYELEKKAFPKF